MRLKPPCTDPALSALFEHCLGESPAAARRLTAQWYAQRAAASANWQRCASGSAASALATADAIEIPASDQLAFWFNHIQRGVVILTIHMGDYLHGMLALLRHAPPNDILILRRKQASAMEQAAFAHLAAVGHRVSTVRHGPGAARKIATGLRKGAIAILLCDLSQRWGATAPIRMLNLSLNWTVGPFVLAALGRALILPVVSYRDKTTPRLALLAPEDARDNPSEAIQTEVCAAFEHYIRRYPAQWHHWHLVAEMQA